MTAIRTRVSPLIWLGLALGMLMITLPAMNRHAVARHGEHAWSAWRYVNGHDPDDDGSDDDVYWSGVQDDGRTVHILRLKQLPGRPVTWAIVICGGGVLVTCWLSQSRKAVRRMKGMK